MVPSVFLFSSKRRCRFRGFSQQLFNLLEHFHNQRQLCWLCNSHHSHKCVFVSEIDGFWQPAVRVYVVFEALEHEKLKDDTKPDICAKCARELMQKLLDQIPTPDRISLAVTQEH